MANAPRLPARHNNNGAMRRASFGEVQSGVGDREWLAPHHHVKIIAVRLAGRAQTVVDAGPVPFAQFAANIQAQTGAAAARGKERFEQVTLHLWRNRLALAGDADDPAGVVARPHGPPPPTPQ